ncbi:uncharacterized protein [Zea mays]|uniref:uncharacterized protein n=1 Tax=Zea mays TaxID=4577 RepID=UPI0009A97589|nr:uncharacterized protein LOC103631294 [Zea mays]|eukprot:XP_020395440.1 uncharacterized protein LOC103631294 [Zea mays]
MVDKDADGRITEEEVKEIITLSASANKLSKITDQAEEYARLIMEELDPGNLGYIELYNLEMLLLQAPSQSVRIGTTNSRYYYWFGPVTGPSCSGPPGKRVGSTRFFPVRAGFRHVSRHVGQHDPARSINRPCLARPYSYQAETGSDRVRVGWPVWTSIAPMHLPMPAGRCCSLDSKTPEIR